MGILAFIITALAIGIVAFIVLLNVSGSTQISEAFRNVAKRLKGSHSNLGGRRHAVYFKSNDVSFQIHSFNREQQIVRVSTRWSDTGYRLRVFPELYSDGLKKFLGMDDIQIGSPAFDSKYVIQSNDIDQLRSVLNLDAQAYISKMSEVNLTISGGDVFVERAMPLDIPANIVRFAQQFVDAYFAMLKGNEVQMELHYIVTDSATCMVCGDDIIDQSVSCLSCKTVHHKDCWDYLGRCSTYGCGQMNYHRVRS